MCLTTVKEAIFPVEKIQEDYGVGENIPLGICLGVNDKLKELESAEGACDLWGCSVRHSFCERS